MLKNVLYSTAYLIELQIQKQTNSKFVNKNKRYKLITINKK